MKRVANKARVLVVDDEALVCEMLSERLSIEGYKCSSAASGDEALEMLRQEPFEIVISDLRMPGISGMTLLQEARKLDPHLAFIMATGEDDVRVGTEAMKRGAADYMVKPFQTDVAVASVQRALETRRMELDLENYRLHLEEMVQQRTQQLEDAMKRIEQTYDETLAALGGALDLRDSGTGGHSSRVTRYSLEIAEVIGWRDEQLKQLARGAALHDIGKIGIPDGILFKKGPLSAEERKLMEAHAQIGYDLVKRIEFLTPAAEVALTHQERYDGTGYPQRLKGEEIPLASRIFAVADALDAMTSDRPYRSARPFADARAEIQRESGRQFDPEVVQAFLSIPETVWQKIRGEANREAAARFPVPPRETANVQQQSASAAQARDLSPADPL